MFVRVGAFVDQVDSGPDIGQIGCLTQRNDMGSLKRVGLAINVPVGGVGEKVGAARLSGRHLEIDDMLPENRREAAADRISPEKLAPRKIDVGPSGQSEYRAVMDLPGVRSWIIEGQ